MKLLSRLVGAFRRDGYENTLSGLSGARADANRYVAPGCKLSQTELEDLYDNNWLARRVVEALPDQALRKQLVVDSGKLDAFNKINNDNRFPNGVLKHGLNMGRLHGGSAILLGVIGSGAPLESPLPTDEAGKPTNSGDVVFLEVFTRWDLGSEKRYEDHPNPIMNGRTEVFKVKSGRLKNLKIHETRLIFCEGVTKAKITDTQEDRDWPWLSVLQPINEVLGNYGISWSAISHLVQEASIGWLRLKGLTDMLTSEDKKVVDERMNLLSIGRNVAKTVFLEAGDEGGNGEEYGRTDVSFTGVAEVLRELNLQVTGASKIPYIILMGDTPSGLNATGEATLTQWYDCATEYQGSSVKPKLERLFDATKVTAKWSFAPMWEPTAKEAVELRSKNAQADQTYFQMGLPIKYIFESRVKDGSLGITVDDLPKLLADLEAEEKKAAEREAKMLEATKGAPADDGNPPKPDAKDKPVEPAAA